MNQGLLTSNCETWETPRNLFEILNREFGFTCDVCALPHNAKCEKYYTPDINGLLQFWSGVCWMNPPYGRKIYEWVKKAYSESKAGAIVVGLLPARTDTSWFHQYIYNKAEIRFLRGRIKFVGGTSNAPFPSMLVIWRGNRKGEII